MSDRAQIHPPSRDPRQRGRGRVREALYVLCVHTVHQLGMSPYPIAMLQGVMLTNVYVQVKTASLRWHSPMLDDISAVSLSSQSGSHKDLMWQLSLSLIR
jgi:hypothetical protein